jgi:hypothetical protein
MCFHRAALDAGCKDFGAPGPHRHLDDPDAFVRFRLNPAAVFPAAVRLGCPIFRPSITLPATVKVRGDEAELASRERPLGTS